MDTSHQSSSGPEAGSTMDEMIIDQEEDHPEMPGLEAQENDDDVSIEDDNADPLEQKIREESDSC